MSSKLRELKKLGKGSSLYLLGDVFVMSVGLITLPVMTRYLTPEEYGVLAMCVVVVGAMVPLFALGQMGSIQRYFFDYSPSDFSTFFSTSLYITLFSGITVITGALLFGAPLFEYLAPGVAIYPYILMALITGFLVVFFQLYMRLQQAKELPVRYTLLRISNSGVGAALAITLVVTMQHKVFASLLAGLIVAVIFSLVFLYLSRHDLALKFNLRMARQSLRYGLPLVPHLLSAFIMGQIGRVFLANQVSLASVGVFSVAYMFYQVIDAIARAVNQAWKPMFFRATRENEENAAEFLGEMTTYYWLFNWMAAFSIAMLGPEILSILAGERFQEAKTIIVPLVIAGIFQTFYFRFITSNMWAKRPELTTVATFIAAGASIAANAVLVPRWGMHGAAYSVVIANAVAAIVVFYTGQRSFYVKYEWPRVFKLLLAFSSTFALSVVLTPSMSYVGIIGVKMLLILTVPLILLLLGFFKSAEVEYIRTIAKRAGRGSK